MKREKIYVVAGNSKEFFYFMEKVYPGDREQLQYAGWPKDLQGLFKPKVIRFGSWYERRDWPEIQAALIKSEAEMVK